MSDLLTVPRTERIEILENELVRVKAEKDHKDNNRPQTKTPSFVKPNKKQKKETPTGNT